MFYVEPVNLHLMSKEKAWELWESGVGKKAEFKDAALAHLIADLLNLSEARIRRAVAGAAVAGAAGSE